ncbi:MAG TPA: ABC transporter ATP-binding protein [Iamia sp.]|nr:ABC transporter ATP-binding protein [Iamia sp.]
MRLISADGLVAGHAGVPAVRDLTIHVDAGEVVALLGPNGAGKTTTLLTIAGVLAPIEGAVEVLGQPVEVGRPHVLARRGLGFVPEDRGLFHQLSVGENLRLARRRGSRVQIDEMVDLLPQLGGVMKRRCGLLSGGEQQMVGLARVLLADPKVVMIDEMSMGLAPLLVQRLLPVARTLATERGLGVLLVEQHVHMALAHADRAYVLNHGELVLSCPAAELLADPDLLQRSYLGS